MNTSELMTNKRGCSLLMFESSNLMRVSISTEGRRESALELKAEVDMNKGIGPGEGIGSSHGSRTRQLPIGIGV